MIAHEDIVLGIRAVLATFEAATTGTAQITCTSAGYSRSVGSFLDDGFAPGMVVTGSGFANSENNATKTITQVTATFMYCAGCVAETEGSRTVSAGLPDVAAENVRYEPTQGVPFFSEQYLPGTMQQVTMGDTGQLEVLPIYVVRIHVPSGTAMKAIRKYADTLLTLFAPGTIVSVSGQDVRVRRDIAPSAGQILQMDGWAFTTVSVPLRVRTPNTL